MSPLLIIQIKAFIIFSTLRVSSLVFFTLLHIYLFYCTQLDLIFQIAVKTSLNSHWHFLHNPCMQDFKPPDKKKSASPLAVIHKQLWYQLQAIANVLWQEGAELLSF